MKKFLIFISGAGVGAAIFAVGTYVFGSIEVFNTLKKDNKEKGREISELKEELEFLKGPTKN